MSAKSVLTDPGTSLPPEDPINGGTAPGPAFPAGGEDVADWIGRAHNRIVENAARRLGLHRRKINREAAEAILNDATLTLVEDEGLPLRAVLEARSKVVSAFAEVGAFSGDALRPMHSINVDLLDMLARQHRITRLVADEGRDLARRGRRAKGSARRFVAEAEVQLSREDLFQAEQASLAILKSVLVRSYDVWSGLGFTDQEDVTKDCPNCPQIAADALGAGAGGVLGGPIGGALLGGFASMVVANGPDEPESEDDGGTTGG